MLTVYIRLVTELTKEVSALCRLLAEDNAMRIRCHAHTTLLAGGVVYDVFPNTEVFQALEVLSILLDSQSNYMLKPKWPDAANTFPNLQKLHMNSFDDCVPILPHSASFSHLSTLVLDGSR